MSSRCMDRLTAAPCIRLRAIADDRDLALRTGQAGFHETGHRVASQVAQNRFGIHIPCETGAASASYRARRGQQRPGASSFVVHRRNARRRWRSMTYVRVTMLWRSIGDRQAVFR